MIDYRNAVWSQTVFWSLVSCFVFAPASTLAQDESSQVAASAGTRVLAGQNGFQIKMLIEASNLGSSEVELAEITFPGRSEGRSHLHGSTELIYVLSGRMDHKIDGVSNILEPGMVGIVRDGESVEHIVLSDEPVRAVVVWAPGGEAKRLEGFFQERPID